MYEELHALRAQYKDEGISATENRDVFLAAWNGGYVAFAAGAAVCAMVLSTGIAMEYRLFGQRHCAYYIAAADVKDAAKKLAKNDIALIRSDAAVDAAVDDAFAELMGGLFDDND